MKHSSRTVICPIVAEILGVEPLKKCGVVWVVRDGCVDGWVDTGRAAGLVLLLPLGLLPLLLETKSRLLELLASFTSSFLANTFHMRTGPGRWRWLRAS